MERKALYIFDDIFNLIPKILKTSKKCVNLALSTFEHDVKRRKIERNSLNEIINLIQGKWSIDIIYTIRVLGESHYNDLKKALKGISSRLLTDRLIMLVDKKILKRNVYETTPIRVSYVLTEFGENLFHLMVPIFVFWLSKTLD
ncbi:MAG: winged helix-turn-helix transcriptional regulator [Promethearchaeota archaeon]